MQDEKKIKEKAFEHLQGLSETELDGVHEIDFEIHLQNEKGATERYTVFLERGSFDDDWTVRNIIQPDALEKPERKHEGKIE